MGAPAATSAEPASGRHPRRTGVIPARLLRLASDERLVELVRDGSEAAFEVIYDRHHRGILAFCRHMLGSREEAEDAVQHTFMAAYRDLLGSDKDIQLRAWLYAIARNRSLSVLRGRRERPSNDLDEPATDGLSAQVQQRADLQDMLKDLAALPEEQREALVLSELGAMPHDEIATVLGVPKDKVKALVFQARTSLHQSREARDTSCHDIREMLCELRGGSLRRTTLRRHLKECAGCREFEAEVKRQRKAMAVLLPVIPSIGLKESALAAAFGGKAAVAGTGAAAVGAAAGGAVATGGTGALVAKVLVVAAVASGGAAGVKSATDGVSGSPNAVPTPAAPANKPIPPAPAGSAESAEAAEQRAERKQVNDRKAKKAARRRGHTDRGKEWAKTRGEGKKRGLLGTQPGKVQDKQRGKSEAAKQKAATRKAKAKTRVREAPLRRRAKPLPESEPRLRPQPTPRATPQRPAKADPTPEPSPDPTPNPTPDPTPVPETVTDDPK